MNFKFLIIINSYLALSYLNASEPTYHTYQLSDQEHQYFFHSPNANNNRLFGFQDAIKQNDFLKALVLSRYLTKEDLINEKSLIQVKKAELDIHLIDQDDAAKKEVIKKIQEKLIRLETYIEERTKTSFSCSIQ